MSLEEIPKEAFLYVMLVALIEDMGGVIALPISEMNKIAQSSKGLYLSFDDDKYYVEVKNLENQDKEIK